VARGALIGDLITQPLNGERTARLVLFGETEQERVQARAFLVAERREEFVPISCGSVRRRSVRFPSVVRRTILGQPARRARLYLVNVRRPSGRDE
jgi:hypothetical protein